LKNIQANGRPPKDAADYKNILEYSGEGVVIHIDGLIVYVNQKMINMLGYDDSAELIGTTALNLIQESRREISKELEDTMLQGSKELISVEDVYERKDGQLLPVEVSVIPVKFGEKDAVQIVARDISERKKVEAEIWEYQNMLKRHSADLILAEEAQRRNLAIALHDNLGQSLAMAKIKIAGLLNELGDAKLRTKVKAIEKDISYAVAETRSLTYELSPPVLHELGFIIALQWRLDKFADETGIMVEYDYNVDSINLRDEQEVILFRSTDEVLKNIVKHAGASQIKVTAHASKYAFIVKVHDDGCGFDTSILNPQKRRRDTFGLFSIKERLEYLGGVLEIQSEDQGGTLVTLNVPVSLEGF